MACAREYEARVRGVPDQHALDRIARGVVLDGRKTAPAEIALKKVIEGEDGAQAVLSIVIREGRNRQVRNMCDAIGHPVVRLRRVRIGSITDDKIRPGEFRELSDKESRRSRRWRRSRKPARADTRSRRRDVRQAGERQIGLRR